MRKSFVLALFLFFNLPSLAQGKCDLKIKAGFLTGSCVNSYFTAFQIPYAAEAMDSALLFSSLPMKGQLIIQDQYKLDVEYVLTTRTGFPQILFKSTPGWFTMDSLVWNENGFSFSIDHDPDVPVTNTDLEIINQVIKMLDKPSSWHQNDDRDCEDDVEKKVYSLFCALKTASIEAEGDYNHRNAIMQKVRHQIEKRYPGREWNHRLMDFNNLAETDFTTIQNLLQEIREEVQTALMEPKK